MQSISHIVRIDKSPESVFSALADNDAIALWFTETQCESWHEGAQVTWFGGSTVMTLSEISPLHSVSFDVHKGSGWEGTHIKFELEPIGDRTLVRFDHAGWDKVTDHFRYCSMSWAYFLESLKLYLETGVGTPEASALACESQ